MADEQAVEVYAAAEFLRTFTDPYTRSLADLIERLQREREALKHDVERHIEIAAAAEREREEIRAATLAECREIAMAYPLDRNASGSDDEKAAAFCIASRIRALAQEPK